MANLRYAANVVVVEARHCAPYRSVGLSSGCWLDDVVVPRERMVQIGLGWVAGDDLRCGTSRSLSVPRLLGEIPADYPLSPPRFPGL